MLSFIVGNVYPVSFCHPAKRLCIPCCNAQTSLSLLPAAGGGQTHEGFDEVLMREYEAEERQMDRDWYDADEFGGAGPGEQVGPDTKLPFRVHLTYCWMCCVTRVYLCNACDDAFDMWITLPVERQILTRLPSIRSTTPSSATMLCSRSVRARCSSACGGATAAL